MYGTVRTVILAASVTLALSGCVTRGTYEELEGERNRVSEERDSLKEYTAALESRMEALQVAHDAATAELAATEAEVVEMRGTYDELVSELESEVSAGQIQIEQIRDGISLNVSQEILFPSGSAQLDEQGRNVIARVATRIHDQSAVISVEGHSDDVGISQSLKSRYPTNWELAGARAASVVRLLSEEGVPPERMRAVSRGPFDPVAPNDSPEGRGKNRRIEILLRPVPSEG
jgi:chemotaxis protein MotB